MQGAHEGHDHDPPRLRRGLALAALAVTPHFAPLPSPVTPLSPEPPLSNGASVSADNVRHRVDSTTRVEATVDDAGQPFRVIATQRLDVRVVGDYFFTIGAPLIDVQRGRDSDAEPGLRTASIVWAGFNPGHRVLVARATLLPRAVAAALPARIEVKDGRRWLVNTTDVPVATFTADALREPLLRYLATLRASLRRGGTPPTGSAELLGDPRSSTARVRAPFRVSGTVSGILRDRLPLPPAGPVSVHLVPDAPQLAYSASDSGRELLRTAILGTFTAARVRQFQTFLGNPDPTGRNETTYLIRTGRRPAVAAPALESDGGSSWVRTALVVVLGAGALLGALAAWSRA